MLVLGVVGVLAWVGSRPPIADSTASRAENAVAVDDGTPAATVEEYRDTLIDLAASLDATVTLSHGQAEARLWVADGTAARFVDVGKPNDPPRFIVPSTDGARLAIVASAGSNTGGSLSVGTPDDLETIAENVVTVTWHVADPPRLAWIERREQQHLLRWAQIDAEPAIHDVTSLPAETHLRGYGDWSFLVETGAHVMTLDVDGRQVAAVPGGVRSVSSDATIVFESPDRHALALTDPSLVGGDDVTLPIPPDTAQLFAFWLPNSEALLVTATTIHPDGARTDAMLVDRDGAMIDQIEMPLAVRRVTWTGDEDTFIFAAASDTADGRDYRLIAWTRASDSDALLSARFDNWLFPIYAD